MSEMQESPQLNILRGVEACEQPPQTISKVQQGRELDSISVDDTASFSQQRSFD